MIDTFSIDIVGLSPAIPSSRIVDSPIASVVSTRGLSELTIRENLSSPSYTSSLIVSIATSTLITPAGIVYVPSAFSAMVCVTPLSST